MPLNSVQLYVKNTLAQATAGLSPPAAVYVAPPVAEDFADHPLVFIWGGHTHQTRRATAGKHAAVTGSTTAGWLEARYDIDIYLMSAQLADDANADSTFPVFVDLITQALRAIPITVQLTDPNTNVASQLVEIGEEITTEYSTVYALEDQRMLLYQAKITAIAKEWYQQ